MLTHSAGPNSFRKDTCRSMFITALLTTAETEKQSRCPSTDKWIKKTWDICTREYCSAMKKNEIMAFAVTWMDLEIIILSEGSQRQISDDITYMWNLKYIHMNLFTKWK